jgi:Ca-activated chloride channel family protein
MLKFAHNIYLYALFALPLFFVLYAMVHRWRIKKMRQFGELQMVRNLADTASRTKPLWKFILLMLGYTALVIGIADPQVGSKLEEVKREGVDIMIALDVSTSMNAEDIKPSRLERSKQAISRLIDKLQNDRIGVIVFAGKAYVQLPITTDFAAAKLFLSTIDSDMIPTQGTVIGSAINLAVKSFNTKDKKHKVLIVITDGEGHEDNAVDEAQAATKEGVVVHTIGMGSPGGGPIPIYKNGSLTGFKKDNTGATVVTRLDATMLQQIAAAGNGKFVRASNSEAGLNALLDEINKMEKKNFGSKMFTDYEDRFQYFMAAALLLLLLELLISEKKNKKLAAINLFGEEKKNG